MPTVMPIDVGFLILLVLENEAIDAFPSEYLEPTCRQVKTGVCALDLLQDLARGLLLPRRQKVTSHSDTQLTIRAIRFLEARQQRSEAGVQRVFGGRAGLHTVLNQPLLGGWRVAQKNFVGDIEEQPNTCGQCISVVASVIVYTWILMDE